MYYNDIIISILLCDYIIPFSTRNLADGPLGKLATLYNRKSRSCVLGHEHQSQLSALTRFLS